MEGKYLLVNASLLWMKWAWVRARVHVAALSPDASCHGLGMRCGLGSTPTHF